VPPAFLDAAIAESLKLPAFVWRAAARALRDEDFSSELGKIGVKTLLVWGDRDSFSLHAEQLTLFEALAHAELHVLRDIGHAVHWEDPETVATLITRFFRRTLALAA
jgi:pimeloyl-ACP methyl ester carboxylesterase